MVEDEKECSSILTKNQCLLNGKACSATVSPDYYKTAIPVKSF